MVTLRVRNVGRVFGEIWSDPGISRADLSRATGLSRTTASDIVNELVDSGLVCEIGSGQSRGGRKPIRLDVIPDARLLVGVEISATNLEIVVMDLRGRVLSSSHQVRPIGSDPARTLDQVAEAVGRCMQDESVSWAKVLGIGVGIESPLQGIDQRRIYPVVLPTWGEIDVVRELENRLGRPVLLDNDANLGALAEYWWGSGRRVSELTYIKMDVGVGAGHIVHGRIYRGFGGTAGEIGHMVVRPGGNPCRCGLLGCLEANIGTAYLESRYQDLTASAQPVEFGSIVERLAQDDAAAETIIEEAGRDVGLAVANVISLLNPERIVLGGGLADAGDHLLASVHRTAAEHAFPKSISEAEICLSTFSHQTVAIGAATRVFGRAMRQSGLAEPIRSTVQLSPTGAGSRVFTG